MRFVTVLAMLATFVTVNNLWMTIVLLTLIAAGTYARKGPFWALSSEWLGRGRSRGVPSIRRRFAW
jgi:hypothetical protein